MNEKLNDQLASQLQTLPRQPGASNPRCMCHNKYLNRCPNEPWDCVCGTERNYPASIRCRNCGRSRNLKTGKVEIASFTQKPEHLLRCKKVGHATKGKAEAHMRSIIRRRELGIRPPDWKAEKPLEVYLCKWETCKENPWHVGHQR